jgi:hypothetical protein
MQLINVALTERRIYNFYKLWMYKSIKIIQRDYNDLDIFREFINL